MADEHFPSPEDAPHGSEGDDQGGEAIDDTRAELDGQQIKARARAIIARAKELGGLSDDNDSSDQSKLKLRDNQGEITLEHEVTSEDGRVDRFTIVDRTYEPHNFVGLRKAKVEGGGHTKLLVNVSDEDKVDGLVSIKPASGSRGGLIAELQPEHMVATLDTVFDDLEGAISSREQLHGEQLDGLVADVLGVDPAIFASQSPAEASGRIRDDWGPST